MNNNPFDPSYIQDEKAEREARRLRLRTNLLIALFCGVLVAFFGVLYQTQIIDGPGKADIGELVVRLDRFKSSL